MIDLHSHLLPGVDDGSRSVDQSLKVLHAMAGHGVTDVCLTPHTLAGRAEAGVPRAHDDAFAALQSQVVSGMPRLHRGAEVMLDRPLSRTVAAARKITLAGSRYMLVEFPRLVPYDTVSNALAQVHDLGVIPLLAHPERYSCCSPEAVRQWRGIGAKMQVDATTLLMSQARGQRARQLVSEGLADILAGDNHGDERTIATGARFLTAQDGAQQVELLVVKNPGAILSDAPLTSVPPLRIRQSWMRRIKEFLEGNR
ncbi:MAG TPA: CpsB/CapC family capsule biosynthesis tyrosine phosphatase [Gemmatimonadales bacterium]|nr:CpsB/CapC family capsule biosynthesis tyrosine phosphatase [Gemmatimonadales bacterium]